MLGQQPVSGVFPASGLPDDQSSAVRVVATNAQGVSAQATALVDVVNMGPGNAVTLTRVVSDAAVPVDADGNSLVIDGLSVSAGVVAPDGQTNNSSPMIAGTVASPLEAGEAIVVFRDGNQVGQATVNGLDWVFTDSNVPQGAHQFSAGIRDSDNVLIASSMQYGVTVDGTPPEQPELQEIAGDNIVSVAYCP